MKVKTFTAWSDNRLDMKINAFLDNNSIEVIEVKFVSPIFYYTAMVLYKEKELAFKQ